MLALLERLVTDAGGAYVFCDTDKELPETYEYLTKIEYSLGIKIERSATACSTRMTPASSTETSSRRTS